MSNDYNTTETVHLPFNTFTSDDPSASVTVTNLAATDLHIHKDGSVTQRSSSAGVTISVDFDGITGCHMAHIDLSDNTDAGFYAAGSRYTVRAEGITVDAGTLNPWIGGFSIGCVLRPTTSGRTLDVNATGEAGLDLDNTSGTLDAAQFGADFLTAAKIADDAISSEHINTGAFTADAFAADAIVAATLATGAISADAFAADAIVAATLATGALTADAFATNALVAATFADNFLTAAKINAAAIDNATFAADVGSTAYATNIIALAVRKALDEIGLDHLLAIADSDDVVDDSVIAKMASKAGTADWSDFDNTTDSLEALADKIVAASPQSHSADSSNDTTGTIDSGTYADTATINSTYWQISPAGAAVGGFGLNVDLVFSVGTGLDRSPEAVNITGYFDSSPVRDTDVWAYNYILAAWDEISNSATNMQNAGSNQNYQYPLTQDHIQTSDGEMKIRFTSTSTTTGDDLYLDYVSVSSVAVEAAGLTADAIQKAVWMREDSGHDEDTLGYNVSKLHLVHGKISSATDATQFVIDTGVSVNDMYNGMIITLEDKTDDHYETRRIIDSIAASNEIIVDRALSFTPVADDDFYIMNAYDSSPTAEEVVDEWESQSQADPTGFHINLLEMAGDAQSLTDLKDFADAGYDPATNKVEGVVLVDTTTTNTDMVGTNSAGTAAELAKVPKSDSNVTFNATALASINAECDTAISDAGLPEGIPKNAIFNNFEFLMVDATDGFTPETGLTVTGTRSIDGGAFAGVSGAIAEVSSGIYQFDAAAADTNGDLITWKFASAGAADRFFTFKTTS